MGAEETPAWVPRLSALPRLEHPPRRLGASVWMVQGGEHALIVKSGPGCPDEAEGLRLLAQIEGAPPVPAVVQAEADLLVTSAVATAARTAAHDESLGRSLAHLHAARHEVWGGGSSWIGACPVDPVVTVDGPAFYGARLTQLAARCGLESAIEPVRARLNELLPAGGPALLHGDLWWGNVLWGEDGRAWLIDPSSHGGHPEEDLAMLALFGVIPERLRRAYAEVLPSEPDWQERIGLFQLIPLLVHTILFGGAYRDQAAATARRYG
jgi:fructosamine-3-kinase